MTPKEERVLFYFILGAAISEWAKVETALEGIVRCCFRGEDEPLMYLGFFSIENFRSKTQFVDTIFQHKFKNTKHASEWSKLLRMAKTHSYGRNKLVHYNAQPFLRAQNGRRWALVQRPILPSVKDGVLIRPKSPPSGSLAIRDIAYLEKQFTWLAFELEEFALQLWGGSTSQGQPEPRPEPITSPPTLAQIRSRIHAEL